MVNFLLTKVFLKSLAESNLSINLDVLNFLGISKNIFHVFVDLAVFQKLNFFLKKNELQKLIFLFIFLNPLITYLSTSAPQGAEPCIHTQRAGLILGVQNE